MAIRIGSKVAQLLLLILNFIFWMAGIGLIGVGVFLLGTGKADVFYIIQPEGTAPMNTITAYCVISTGCLMVLVGFLGCCGAMRKNRSMLVTYLSLILILLLAEVVGSIVLVVYKKQLEETMQSRLQDSLMMNYGESQILTNGFNAIQRKHHCCGIMGPDDYLQSKWYNQSQAGHDGRKIETVPADCCNPHAADDMAVTVVPRTCYTAGCFEQVKNDSLPLYGIVIGVGAGIAGLELIGVIFAICLWHSIAYDS